MKLVLFVLFFSLGMSVFAAKTVTKSSLPFELGETMILKAVPSNTENLDNKTAYTNFYYSFEWLYGNSPFIKKLIALT